MKRVPHSGEIDLTEWELPNLDLYTEALTVVLSDGKLAESVQGAIRRAASDALGYMLDDDDSYAYMPFKWDDSDGLGGEPVTDPLQIYVRFALGGEEYPTWSFSLRESIAWALRELNDDFEGAPDDIRGIRVTAGEIAKVTALRDALFGVCEELGEVIANPEPDDARS